MSFVTFINPVALVVGYISLIAISGLLVWHAVIAYQRYRKWTQSRSKERARAQARTEVPSDQIEEVWLGDSWAPPP